MSPGKPFLRLHRGGENWDGSLQAPAPPVPSCPALVWPLPPARPLIFLLPQAAPAACCAGVLGAVSLLGPGCT